MDKGERQLQVLGVFVHGVLAGLHALGIIYNLRRRNYSETAIHTAAATFSVVATTKHMRKVNDSGSST